MESLAVFIRTYGYPALFGGMVLEQFVPPMPGEPLLLGAGALAGTGYFRLWFAAALALAGTVVGDLVWYEIGRRGGRQVLKRLCRISIEPAVTCACTVTHPSATISEGDLNYRFKRLSRLGCGGRRALRRRRLA